MSFNTCRARWPSSAYVPTTNMVDGACLMRCEDAMRNGVALCRNGARRLSPIVKRRPGLLLVCVKRSGQRRCVLVGRLGHRQHHSVSVGGKGERRIGERIDQAGTSVDRNMHCGPP